jgi:hypothetical protein
MLLYKLNRRFHCAGGPLRTIMRFYFAKISFSGIGVRACFHPPRGSVVSEERMYKVITISRSLAKKLERLIEELRGKNKDVRDYGDAIEFLVEFYEKHKSE